MRSHLLEGMVRHRRARPTTYGLEHDVYYFALDLDELDDARSPAAPRRPQPPGRGRRSATLITCSPPATDLRR